MDDDSIILEFQRTDGTLITQLLDFRNVSKSIGRKIDKKRFFYQNIKLNSITYFRQKQDILVLKALVLGEEERGQSQYQVMCFVSRLSKNDFISTDAMSKLRQVCFF